jgi:hypothetical protein
MRLGLKNAGSIGKAGKATATVHYPAAKNECSTLFGSLLVLLINHRCQINVV